MWLSEHQAPEYSEEKGKMSGEEEIQIKKDRGQGPRGLRCIDGAKKGQN